MIRDFLGALSFDAPWMLLGLLILPLLLALLRLLPPAPRQIDFPAIRLLAGLDAGQPPAAFAPWWLLALRLLITGLILLALAHPLHHARPLKPLPLLLVLDDGWAAGADWPRRQDAALSLVQQAERSQQPVWLLRTAAGADGHAPSLLGPLPAGQARAVLASAQPVPWEPDHQAAAAALAGHPLTAPLRVVWLSDGLSRPDTAALLAQLQPLTPVELRVPEQLPLLLSAGGRDPAGLRIEIGRIEAPATERKVQIQARDSAGRILERLDLTLKPGERITRYRLDLPVELRNRVGAIDLDAATPTAAGLLLLDGRSQAQTVGLAEGSNSAAPLQDDGYYLARALPESAQLRTGPLDTLLEQAPGVLLLPDRAALGAGDVSRLRTWLESGGVVLRIGGPRLAAAAEPDDLVPLPLQSGGGRYLGGALSWSAAQSVAAAGAESPLAGLQLPDTIRVRAFLSARTDSPADSRVWLRLQDGSPLLSARPVGQGWLVFLHSSLSPDWSDLGLSALPPLLLDRVLLLARGESALTGDVSLPPYRLLDGFAEQLSAAGGLAARPLAAAALDALPPLSPSPLHPPGSYGSKAAARALNLGPALQAQVQSSTLNALEAPPGFVSGILNGRTPERDLRPPLLLAALLGLLLDLVVMVWIRRRQG